MTELPMFDERGGSLVSYVGRVRASLEDPSVTSAPAFSLVVVTWSERVLLGFHVRRHQWELPGGSVEAGESAHDAALRELEEETGVRANGATLVGRAAFTFDGDETMYRAAVFSVTLTRAPILVVSDELKRLTWWDPSGELFDGQSPLDAEVARRCVASE